MKSLYFVLICLVAISDIAISSNTEHLSETQKEPIFEGTEDDNYIIIYFNQEVKYNSFLFDNRISKIMMNNELQSLDSQLTIPLNTSLKVYFKEKISSFGRFFFTNDEKISYVNFSNFDSSELVDMYQLFYQCKALKSIDFSNLNLSKLTDVRQAFYECSSLESVNFPENQINVEKME